MKIADLFVAIGIQVQGAPALGSLDTQLGKTAVSGQAAAAGVASVGNATASAAPKILKAVALVEAMNWALIKLAENAAKAGTALRNYSLQTGQSTDVLQEWQHIAAVNDVSARELTETFKDLQTQAAAFKLGEPQAVGAWSLLGVNPTQDPNKVLADLRENLRKFDDVGQARLLAEKIGISDHVFQMLVATNKEYDKLNGAFKISEKQIDILRRQDAAWENLRFSLRSTATSFGAVLAPMFENLAKILNALLVPVAAFVKWLSETKWFAPLRWAVQALVILFLALGVALAGVTALLAFYAIQAGIALIASIALGVGVTSLSGIFTALLDVLAFLIPAVVAFAVAIIPVIVAASALVAVIALLVAAFAGLFLLWDDFNAAVHGRPSLFDWEGEIWMVNKLAEGLEWLIGLWDKLTGKKKDGSDNRGTAWKDAPADETMFKGDDRTTEELNAKARARVIESLKTVVVPVTQDVALPAAPDVARPNTTNNSRSSTVTQENIIQISVDGSDRPTETARAVGTSLDKQLNQAFRQLPVPNI